jgi:hypothetical protein
LSKQEDEAKLAAEKKKAEEEGGPLAKLLKAQEETNSLLKAFLKSDEDKEKEKGVEVTKQTPEEEAAAKAKKEEDVAKAMEQTTQGPAKQVEGAQPGKPWNPQVVNQIEGEKDKDKEKPYPYPYPEEPEEKSVKKAFPFPYGAIATKREEVVAKALELANQEIGRLNARIAKMIPAEKVEEMVNARFQQKMQEEGFVASSGALPANLEKAGATEIRKSLDGTDEVTEAEGIMKQVVGLDWEHIIGMRRSIDPAYNAFLGAKHGLPLKGGM